MKESIELNDLKSCLEYNALTGLFYWKYRHSIPAHLNKKLMSKPAGALTNKGYISIRIGEYAYLAHRLAWFYQTGVWPDKIDHDNRIRTDNRFSNLKSVTVLINNKNKSIGKNNTSGHVGVSFFKKNQKWMAHICVNSKSITLGYFSEMSDAISVRQTAQFNYEFHKNHGTSIGIDKSTLLKAKD